jgi:hypothetical protein
LLLLVVFGLKAALLPLYFWLPRAYAEASAPVAALFAIMTKVGIYSILRVYTLIFGAQAGELANLAQDWLWPLALLGIVAGALGALAASTCRAAGYLVLSAGTLMAALAIGTQAALGAALYYLLHSTWVAGGLARRSDRPPARRQGRRAGAGPGAAAAAPARRAVLPRRHRRGRLAAIVRLHRQGPAVAGAAHGLGGGGAVERGAAQRPGDPGRPEPRRQHPVLARWPQRAGQRRA